MEFISKPWPWYVAGPLIGLMVPLLLLLGNKKLGISSNLRHICAICVPAGIPFFKYNWRRESWNLLFVLGVVIGGILVSQLTEPTPLVVNEKLKADLAQSGITDFTPYVPADLFNFKEIFRLRGFLMLVVGGFLVGFGTRYAGGCTSGHSIMGISQLQPASMVATVCFMAGGILTANFILPYILNL